MTQIDQPNPFRKTDFASRAYRLLIDKNFSPELAATLSRNAASCRLILGDLTPAPSLVRKPTAVEQAHKAFEQPSAAVPERVAA